MKKIILIFLSVALFHNIQAQIVQPVKWQFTTQHIKGNQYYMVFQASIDDGWSVYSQYLENDDGPIPTSISFQQADYFELIGKPEESAENRKKAFDEIFEMNLVKYYKLMTIKQHVIVKDITQPIKGYLTFMTCDNTRCLAPEDVDFSVNFKLPPQTPEKTNGKPAIKKKPIKQTKKGQRITTIAPIGKDKTDTVEKIETTTPPLAETRLYGLSSVSKKIAENCIGEGSSVEKKNKTLIGIFILGMLGGLLAFLTPCVFPLIPLTVSFFTKTSESRRKGLRNAILYGVFIFSIYALLSAPFHMLESINPDILNQISTNFWLNLAFFVIFIFFAFSFFGYYNISAPSSLTNKISSAEGVGGIIGIFFMALTLSLVSFSCTGPILGSLLAGALTSDGGAWQLTFGMTGFGLALALPFSLFAIFPSGLAHLPKSGGWLNSVKVILGFIELALAFKFLSNADLVMHWGILRYELFMAIWILIGLGLILYLLGVIRFPLDPKTQKLSLVRVGISVAGMLLITYLAFGFTYNKELKGFNSLSLLSGLAPPAGYSWIYPNECPHGINCFKDLKTGLAYAKQQRKPILLDFTGYACVNCRKMEEHVWSDRKIFDYLNDRYVLISLYVDDKRPLPKTEKIEVDRINGGKRKLRNYGQKWAHFQSKYFQTNTQPYYVLLSPDGSQMLNQPVGYTPDVDHYEAFLECGINTFQKMIDQKDFVAEKKQN